MSAAPAPTVPPEVLRRLPKAELHCHLEGSVPAATAIALARARGVALPVRDPDDLYRFSTLEEFLERYVWVSGLLVSAQDFATATYDALVEGARASGLRYREFAVNPTNHPGLPYRELLAGLLDGAAGAARDAGVVCRFVVAVNREQGPAVAVDLVRQVLASPDPAVVAVGLDHNERLGPPAAFAEAFRLAAAGGLHRTAHAGERGDVAEVVDSLDLLGVDRLDHGYALLGDPAVTARVRDEGIHVAACWSTSVFHADAAPPVGGLLDAGLSVSLSSDDPPMFGTDVGEEFVRAGAALRWTPAQARAVCLAGFQGAFLDDADRAPLVRAAQAELDALLGAQDAGGSVAQVWPGAAPPST